MKQMLLILTFITISSCVFAQQSISTPKYLESLRKEAFKSFYSKNYKEATNYFLTLSNENPYNSNYQFFLGLCNFSRGNVDDSIDNFQKAWDLGYMYKGTLAFQMARSYAYKKEDEKAIKWLKESIKGGFVNYKRIANDTVFATLKNDKAFKTLLGLYDLHNNRINSWKQDINYLKEQAELIHYDLFHVIPKKTWDKSFAGLLKQIPKLNDIQITLSLMKIMAMLNDGHSKIVLPYEILDTQIKFKKLPLALIFLEDGIYIKGIKKTVPNSQNLIGAKITTVNNIDVNDVVESFTSFLGSDNRFNLRSKIETAICIPEIVNEITQTNQDAIIFKLQLHDGTTKLQEFTDFDILNIGLNDWVFNEDWTYLGEHCDKGKLLWRKQIQMPFWYELVQDSILYTQINQIIDTPDKKFKSFNDDLFNRVKASKPKCLVIDLRWNGGGSSFLNIHLIKNIIQHKEYDNKDKLFVLIGKETFSAAQNLVTDLQYFTNATFIGTPTGSKPNFIGEGTNITLPYSGLMAVISNNYHQGGQGMSIDGRKWITPDHLSSFSINALNECYDPAFNSVINLLNKD